MEISVFKDHPLKSMSHDICSCPSGRLKIAFSIRYTRWRMFPSGDFVFCVVNWKMWTYMRWWENTFYEKQSSVEMERNLLPRPHYEDSSSIPIMKISFRDLACFAFVCYLVLVRKHTFIFVNEDWGKFESKRNLVRWNFDAAMDTCRLQNVLTQRISSGLNSDLHLRVASNIFWALSRFQFRASKYLLRHASEQNFRLRPESGPRAFLSCITCDGRDHFY